MMIERTDVSGDKSETSDGDTNWVTREQLIRRSGWYSV